MSATYRGESDQEPVVEAAVSALLPATRERLDEAFRREEALAYRKHALVEHPMRWLLAGAVGAAVLVLPQLRHFGHIDGELFAARLPMRAMAMSGLAWGIACSALGLRSMRLRRGGLPAGVHLFASSLIEVKGERVRVWPLSRLRTVTQNDRVATLDLGADGRLQLTTDEKDLASALDQIQEQLTQARITHDSKTAALLDPVHAERERGSLRPVVGPARLPTSVLSPGRVAAAWAGSVLAILLVSVLVVEQARYLSDRLGIERARRGEDTAQLRAYLSQDGPLVERAEQAWLSLCKSDAQLIEYLNAPYVRHHEQANTMLSERFLARTSPDRPATPDAPYFDRRKAIVELRGYLAPSLGMLRARPQLEQRLFDLSIAESQLADCMPSGEDLLQPYILGSDERGDRARETQWKRTIDGATRCNSFRDLEALRSLATSPTRQDEFRQIWRQYFERQRGTFAASWQRLSRSTKKADEVKSEDMPEPLIAQIDQIWAYVAQHSELQLRQIAPTPRKRTFMDRLRPRKTDFSPLMDVIESRSDAWNRLLSRLSGNPMAWQVSGPDAYLTVQGPTKPPAGLKDDRIAIESVLTLPGSEPQTAQFTVPCLCPTKDRKSTSGAVHFW